MGVLKVITWEMIMMVWETVTITNVARLTLSLSILQEETIKKANKRVIPKQEKTMKKNELN